MKGINFFFPIFKSVFYAKWSVFPYLIVHQAWGSAGSSISSQNMLVSCSVTFLSQVVMVLCVSPQLTSGGSKMSPDLAESCPLPYSELSPEDMLPGPGRASYEPPVGIILSHLSSLSLLSPVSMASVFCPGKWIPRVLLTPGRSPYRSRGFAVLFVCALFSSFQWVQAISPLSWTWPSQWWLLLQALFQIDLVDIMDLVEFDFFFLSQGPLASFSQQYLTSTPRIDATSMYNWSIPSVVFFSPMI